MKNKYKVPAARRRRARAPILIGIELMIINDGEYEFKRLNTLPTFIPEIGDTIFLGDPTDSARYIVVDKAFYFRGNFIKKVRIMVEESPDPEEGESEYDPTYPVAS